jgi:hypothetical protein
MSMSSGLRRAVSVPDCRGPLRSVGGASGDSLRCRHRLWRSAQALGMPFDGWIDKPLRIATMLRLMAQVAGPR